MNEFKNFFLGGELCLDFCNTFDHLHIPPEHDYLSEPSLVFRWGQAAGILSADKKGLPSTNDSLKDLLQTRVLIFKIFSPFTRKALPEKNDLELLNTLLHEKAPKVDIVLKGNRFSELFNASDAFEQMEYEVIRSASNLLLSIIPGRLKQCEGCGWLFYDQSRTHARRWCSMELCGNRAKARRHYERVRTN